MARKTGKIKGKSVRAAVIAERMRLIATRYSQAEIARRTGITPNRVSRYFRGAKIPLDFAGALVREFGVNPSWLLAGEGTPWLADVSAVGNDDSQGMLELVQAIGSVEKMKLGALVGNKYLNILRELNESLKDYESLRARLNARTRPVLAGLIEDLKRQAAAGDGEAAEATERAARQMALLCDDDDTQVALLHVLVLSARTQGDTERSLEAQRRLFKQMLAADEPPDEQEATQAASLINELFAGGYMHEAQKMCRSFKAMIEGTSSLADEAKRMAIMDGVLDVQLGDVRHGLSKVIEAYRSLPRYLRTALRHHYLDTMLTTGCTTMREAMSTDRVFAAVRDETSRSATSNIMLLFAIWHSDATVLGEACTLYAPGALADRGRQFQPVWYFADCMRDAATDQNTDAARRFIEHPEIRAIVDSPVNPQRFRQLVAWTEIARRCGSLEALTALERADEALHATPKEIRQPFLWCALHYRSACALIAPQSVNPERLMFRNRAESFLAQSEAKGYGCLARTWFEGNEVPA